MKFLIIGYGSIGQRHCKNLDNILKNKKNIIICRKPGEERVPGFTTFFNLNDALSEKPDASIIAVPTNLHIPIALKCAKAGTHLFIEKPLSNNLKGAKELAGLVRQKNLVVMIGCDMRFNPGLKKIKELIGKSSVGKIISAISQVGQYLPDWRPGVKYQNVYSAKKSLGGGVVLDLIHELDYLYWFFGGAQSLVSFVDKSSSLKIDTEDNADILLKFKNNIKANVHLDYIQRCPRRTCQIIGEKGTIFWDCHKNSVDIYTSERGWKSFIFKNFEPNDVYIDEMRHFIACIKKKRTPLIDLKQGIEVLKIALAAKEFPTGDRAIKLF